MKVKYKNGSILKFHKGLNVDKLSLNDYLNYLNNILERKAENYSNESDFLEINFNYLPIPVNREDQFKDVKWADLTIKKEIKLPVLTFDNIKLPANSDYLSWGEIIVRKENSNSDFIVITSNNFNYTINTTDKKLYTIVLYNKKTIISFTDNIINEDFLIRKIDTYTFYISKKENKIMLFTKTLNTKFLEPLNKKK